MRDEMYWGKQSRLKWPKFGELQRRLFNHIPKLNDNQG